MASMIIVCPIFQSGLKKTKALDRFVRFVSNQGQKKHCQYNLSYCSDFRNENNGNICARGGFFFSSDTFRIFN